MLSDIEELTREGMREFAATVHVPPDLAARTWQRHKRRRLTAYATAAGAVGTAGATAVAVGVALSAGPVGVALPPSHPATSHPAISHPGGTPRVRLAAWTVTRQADGNIKITFREAADIAGLQRTLRADGVPASVTYAGQQNPACRPFSGGPAFWPFGSRPGPFDGKGFMRTARAAFDSPYALVLDPTAVPSGAGVQIMVAGTPGAADNFSLTMDLVKASSQCTGS
jgi:hypothetical protein